MIVPTSFQIAKVKGIPIRLHFTLLVTFVLISWTVAVRFTPNIYPGLSSIEYWTVGILGAIVLFLSVTLHELSHSVMAMRYGLHVREIILFIFGGVSNIEDLDAFGERKINTGKEVSKEFKKEFKIAVAGPVTSFILAGIFSLLFLLISQGTLQSESVLNRVVGIILLYGTIVNAGLGIFNLVPAFPLDGGRILRAVIFKWKHDYEKATKIAAKTGVIISYVFMAVGFIIMLFGDFFGGTWILLVGWFLNNGAQSYLSQHYLTSLLEGVRLRDIMNTNIISLKETFTVGYCLKEYFNKHAKDSFPVLDDQGRLRGLVTFKDAFNTSEAKRDSAYVKEIMIPANNLIMPPFGHADEALMKMTNRPVRKIFICDDEKKLLGLVSKTDIMDTAMQRKEYMKKVKNI
ncbi:MAG: site-2 protease family protein [Nitrososphaerota archaeon]